MYPSAEKAPFQRQALAYKDIHIRTPLTYITTHTNRYYAFRERAVKNFDARRSYYAQDSSLSSLVHFCAWNTYSKRDKSYPLTKNNVVNNVILTHEEKMILPFSAQ